MFCVQCLIGHCLSLLPLCVIHQLATSYYLISYHQSSLTIAVVTVLGTPMLFFTHTERRLTKGQQPVNHCLLAVVLSVLHRLTASYCPFVILKWNIKLKIKGNSVFISYYWSCKIINWLVLHTILICRWATIKFIKGQLPHEIIH